MGVAGTRLYPLLLGRWGINNTGMLGFTSLSLCLTLCVVSAWVPGSPFVLYSNNGSEISRSAGENSTNITHNQDINDVDVSYISVSLLLAGIISSRLGLWVADLSVHQIFQQLLEERHRGTISGVQTGLESFMNLIKFGLVIAFPNPDKFGYLIGLSFLVII